MLDDVPEAHREAAEEIRAHLVTLRGGAPFLSSSDARLLVRWLDEEVPVGAILRALERAAEARRKRRSRIPLSLGHARRHLGKPTRGAPCPRALSGRHPLEPLARALEALSTSDARGPALVELAEGLLVVDPHDPEDLVREALARTRGFFQAAWSALGEQARTELIDSARADLGDLAALVDEATLQAALEEAARDRLRQAYPLLSAATIWDLCEDT